VKFLLDNWYLFAVALVSGGLLLWPTLRRGAQGGALSTADAVHVPLAQIETSTALPKNKALPLVVVCASGARATRAIGILRKAGYENARALAGGLKAWREANLPVEKSA
jgi:rhodanese-related sulfurtransferase